MVLRAPFPLSRIPAYIEHSMKLLCVCVNIEALSSLIMMADSTPLAAGLGLEAVCLSLNIYNIPLFILYNIAY